MFSAAGSVCSHVHAAHRAGICHLPGTAIGEHHGLHGSRALRMRVGKHRPIGLDESGVSRHPQVGPHIPRRLAGGVEQAEAKA